MSQSRQFDIAVLGGGPAGLVAALAAAQHARTALIVNRLPAADDLMRIDTIPARTLALLVELGVNPRELGTTDLHNNRWASWEAALPQRNRGSQTAHIERPRLEQALFAVVCTTDPITIIMDEARPRWTSGVVGTGWRAHSLIDATGRASVTARGRKRAALPWASRFFWTGRGETKLVTDFCIAALSCGYAYRVGSADHIGIGIAGRGRWLNGSVASLDRLLRNEGAGWLCDGMPALSSMRRGASGASSVQWARGGRAALCGDSALARDPLSSQGLAASISDALYAVAAVMSGEERLLRDRQAANLARHLADLKELIVRCRFRKAPLWRAYESFLQENILHNARLAPPALKRGRIVANSPLTA